MASHTRPKRRSLHGSTLLEEPLVLSTPTRLVGAPGTVLRGSYRDALVRVRSEVTIEGVAVERIARSDGSPSWGSCVVVESGGVLVMRGCRLTGAAHGYLVDPAMKLRTEESWMHAGVDVRGTGHAHLLDCLIEDCPGAGASASIFPADDRPNLVLEATTIRRCGVGIRVQAQARVRLEGGTVEAVSKDAISVEGGRLNASRTRVVSPGGTGILATGGVTELDGVRFAGVAGSAIWAEREARLEGREVVVEDCAGSAVVAKGRAQVTLRGASLSRWGCNGIEVAAAATLDATQVTLEGAGIATIRAMDAGRAKLDGCTLRGAPTWALFADAVAEVVLEATSLPAGRVELRGAARAEGAPAEAWDLVRWTEELAARGPNIDAPARSEVARRIELVAKSGRLALDPGALVSLCSLLPQWGEVGLAAPPAMLRTLGRTALGAAVIDLFAIPGACLAILADRSLLLVTREMQVVWRTRLAHVGQRVFASGPYLGVLACADPWNHGLSVHRVADGAQLGTLPVSGLLSAVKLGSTTVVFSDEATGHPTDRCSLRLEWPLGAAPAQATMVGHAGTAPAGENDWVSGEVRWPGGSATRASGGVFAIQGGSPRTANAITGRGSLVLLATDLLRLYDDNRLLAVLGERDVAALAADDLAWAGTRTGELVCLEIGEVDHGAAS
jgi:hypothetical protein